jgi:hypothetical protein
MNTKINKQIGIWLDHSQAHFIDISKGPAIVETTYADEHGREHFAGEAAIGTKLGPRVLPITSIMFTILNARY